jgi:hypothetical protein
MEMIHEQRIKLSHIKYSVFIIDYDILTWGMLHDINCDT